MDVQEVVQRQFGPVAAAYATASVQKGGPELTAMLAVELRGDERVLDVACGAGHTALAFAPRVAEVVAVDVTEAMLATGRRLAEEQGIGNVTFQPGDAEALPFADASFDLVTCRYAAHHFAHPTVAAREWARVLKPGGSLLLADLVSPDNPAADTVLNAAEILRDPSHVRDYRIAEWYTCSRRRGWRQKRWGSGRCGCRSLRGRSECVRPRRRRCKSRRSSLAHVIQCVRCWRSSRMAPLPVRWRCCAVITRTDNLIAGHEINLMPSCHSEQSRGISAQRDRPLGCAEIPPSSG